MFNVGTWQPGSILEIKAEELEQAWRVGCLGGFIVGQVAARGMLKRGQGTILFSGATASIRGSANFAALAIPKFGLRALAQSMARELGSRESMSLISSSMVILVPAMVVSSLLKLLTLTMPFINSRAVRGRMKLTYGPE